MWFVQLEKKAVSTEKLVRLLVGVQQAFTNPGRHASLAQQANIRPYSMGFLSVPFALQENINHLEQAQAAINAQKASIKNISLKQLLIII